MEIMMLMLLYFLAQNPDFPESVKPLMGKLKNSEEMLKFLNDLSRFSEMFSLFQKQGKEKDKTPPPRPLPKAKRRSLPHRRRPKKKKSRNPRPAELRTNLSSSASNDISKRSERRRP
ncbi:MAG: hypothetical protein ACLR06_05845 [Christensenellaceae bacterium]